MSQKKKIYIGIIIVLIAIALVLLFTGKVASQPKIEENIQASSTPAVNVTNGIPDNMSISNEIGG
jgi:flagellar basal body-associated protein FliL